MKIPLLICLMCLVSQYDSSDRLTQKNLQLLYKITGEGKPLVLVPGGLTGWASWDPFVPLLSKNKKVIQVQLLNVQYGLENRPLPEDYSPRLESKALRGALSSARVDEKADFVGWSYGALVLLDYALNHPEKVRTLTLIEPPALWIIRNDIDTDPQLVKVKGFLSAAPGPDETITDKDLEQFLVFAGFSKPGEAVTNLPQWNAWRNFKQSLRCNRAVLNHNDNAERLRRFQVPVLLVKGTGSAYFLHRIIDACEKAFPDSRVVEFPGGHAPHIVSGDQFLEAMDEFQRAAD